MTRDDFTPFDIETTGRVPWKHELLVAGIGDTAYFGDDARQRMHALVDSPGAMVSHTGFDARWALLDGASLSADIHDTRTMAWLLDEDRGLKLEELMLSELGETIAKPLRRRKGRVLWDMSVRHLHGYGHDELVPIENVPRAEVARYNEDDLEDERRLYVHLRARLQEENLWELFLRDEVPLANELVLMEAAGLPFNERLNEKLLRIVEDEAGELAGVLQQAAGLPINLGSTQQLADLLFTPKGKRVEIKAALPLDERMRVEIEGVRRKSADDDEDPRAAKLRRVRAVPDGFVPRKVGRDYVHGVWVTKGRGLKIAEHGFGSSTHWKQKAKKHKRPSTSSVSLVLMNPKDPFVADLVYWRELDKLGGAFLARFPEYARDGRLYGTFNRCGTVTGRFSSSEPNLQNIPAHGQYGKLVRALFGGRLALGDYAQLEQRVAAHLSEDPALLKAYHEEIDLYGLAAATLFGGDAVKLHPKRGLMKTGMLSLQYGAGSGKLAQLMLIDGHKMDGDRDPTDEDARELIEQLKRVFPDFFAWRDDCIMRAIRNGYAMTLGGRYRRLAFPEDWARRRKRARQWYSKEESSAGFAMERQAVNAECQGGAGDIVSGGMVVVGREMTEEVQVLVQVHDELVWERLEGWGRGSLARLRDYCENGFLRDHGLELKVPIVFEAKLAKSWAEKDGGATNANSLFRERTQRDRNRAEGLQAAKASQKTDAGAREKRLEAYRGKAAGARSFGNGGLGKRNRRTR
jgi:DNA polymerase I-like protein with 3'-5' exonuclease and polymerase domains